jgi:hypothetical protein
LNYFEVTPAGFEPATSGLANQRSIGTGDFDRNQFSVR